MGNRATARELVRKLEKQGFDVVRTSGGHWKVTYPGRPGHVILAFSPKSSGMHLSIKRLEKLGYKP
jgi:predicted RNA binding protein YcfA (HicA-like mRNA interferase family)